MKNLDKLDDEVKERSARTALAALHFLESFFCGTATIEIKKLERERILVRLIPGGKQ